MPITVASRPLGVSVMPLENRREAILRIATTADRLGYEAVFLTETWAHDTTVLLSEVAARTQRIHLGSGVLGVWGRSAATLAMAASTLHAVSEGRFILGLGASTAQLTEGLHDVPFETPVKQMRRVLTQVRALLKGDRVPLAVATGARPLRLNLPPTPTLPIYLAGLAEETIRLAGELADGWFPFLFPYARLAEGVALLNEGASRNSRAGHVPAVCPFIPAVAADNPADARNGAAWFLVFYMTSMGPFYPKMLARQGFQKEVDAIVAANPGRDSAVVVPPEAEGLLEQLTLFGTPEQARARLTPWYAAGASLPILLLRPNLSPEEIDFTLSAFRPDPPARGGYP
ncbi:MAG: LLM class flavin-dependent oxidoreductase [Candidatus Rokubacteria bacterium]|nr:LLM class flavin-dependent oxidoreductase [Candidatus Rokubacteria bacterium]